MWPWVDCRSVGVVMLCSHTPGRDFQSLDLAVMWPRFLVGLLDWAESMSDHAPGRTSACWAGYCYLVTPGLGVVLSDHALDFWCVDGASNLTSPVGMVLFVVTTPWVGLLHGRGTGRVWSSPPSLLLIKLCSSSEWTLARCPARRRQSLSASSHARRWAK